MIFVGFPARKPPTKFILGGFYIRNSGPEPRTPHQSFAKWFQPANMNQTFLNDAKKRRFFIYKFKKSAIYFFKIFTTLSYNYANNKEINPLDKRPSKHLRIVLILFMFLRIHLLRNPASRFFTTNHYLGTCQTTYFGYYVGSLFSRSFCCCFWNLNVDNRCNY